MAYTVIITATDGTQVSYPCAGKSDQDAMIYAGKVIEANADSLDAFSRVTVLRDGKEISTATTVREVTKANP
jgi:hypothetical protein